MLDERSRPAEHVFAHQRGPPELSADYRAGPADPRLHAHLLSALLLLHRVETTNAAPLDCRLCTYVLQHLHYELGGLLDVRVDRSVGHRRRERSGGNGAGVYNRLVSVLRYTQVSGSSMGVNVDWLECEMIGVWMLLYVGIALFLLSICVAFVARTSFSFHCSQYFYHH